MMAHHLPSFVRTLMSPAGGARGTVEGVTWLTPYAAETIGQAAWRAGPGTRLDVIIPARADADDVAAVEALFGWLAEKGVAVTIRRDAEEA
jgi:hypothetical protein